MCLKENYKVVMADLSEALMRKVPPENKFLLSDADNPASV
jgi:hypothetical protein